VGINSSAYSIAQSVNSVSGSTGITASASTEATISNLSTDGTISFELMGQNAQAVTISATVTADNLGALATAINAETGNTGIVASLSNETSELVLTNQDGYDIKIGNFSHSSDTAQTMEVTGAEGTASTTLSDGGAFAADSTVVGGTVKFSAIEGFQVSSNITGESAELSAVDGDGVETAGGSSLFAGAASEANASELAAVNEIDISTREGANEAIEIATAALAQIDSARGDLGAVQNRFESTIANLASVSENVSAARSRVRDADFAAETAELARGQILQQAGISMLAQANASQQNVLSLLQ
jgi:flagellin